MGLFSCEAHGETVCCIQYLSGHLFKLYVITQRAIFLAPSFGIWLTVASVCGLEKDGNTTLKKIQRILLLVVRVIVPHPHFHMSPIPLCNAALKE